MAENNTDNKASQIGFIATFCIIAVVNLIGNTLVIMIIITNKFMKSPMNFLLVNLAVADMMVGIFLAPRYIFTYFVSHPDGRTGTLICKLLTGANLAWIGGAASIMFLVVISFERYCAVIHPFSTKSNLNLKKVKPMAAACWIFAVVLNIPLFLFVVYNKETNFCAEEWPRQQMWLANAYTTIWFVFAGIIPTIVMFVLYSRIIYTLWFKHSENQIQGTQLTVLKTRKRISKMLVTVSLVYCVCWLPNLTIYFLHYYGVRYKYADVHFVISNVLITCNSAINPFIYGLQSEKFRVHMKELVCCLKLCKNSVGVVPRIQGTRQKQFLELALQTK